MGKGTVLYFKKPSDIEEAIMRAGMSKAEFCRRTGLKPQGLWLNLTDKKTISPSMAMAIISVLGLRHEETFIEVPAGTDMTYGRLK